jgi:hypothetical protein
MAKAQVEITAVDRSKVAIDSASRGLQKLEAGAAKLQSRFNLAFSIITGGFIINGFTRLASAAAKTEQGSLGFAQALDSVKKSANQLFAPSQGIDGATEAMYELRDALNDPGIQSALNGIIDTMLVGFTKAATAIVKTAGTIRSELVALGALSAKTTEDQIALLERQLAAVSPAPMVGIPEVGAGGAMMELSGVGGTDARRAQLQEQLRQLRESQLVGVEVTGRRRATPLENFYETQAFKDLQAREAAIKPILEMEEKLFESVRMQIIETADATYDELQKIQADIPDLTQETVDQISVFAEQAARNMQSAFAEFLFDPFQNGLKGMLKGFVDTIRRMVAEFAASQLMKFFFTPFASGSGLLASFAKFAIGGKAMGGSVLGSKPYIVGERGPELFVPGSNGSIVPNDRMGGVTVAPVYNIDARGATADLQKALPGILQENNRRIFDELDRRYGIGR